MKLSIRTKLSITYMLVSLICVLLTSVISNILLRSQFNRYILDEQQKRYMKFVNIINQNYENYGGFREEDLETTGVNALEEGLILKVTDSSGNIIWDAMEHNEGVCHQMLENMASNMHSKYANWQGGYEEKTYQLKGNGKVDIGYYGPFYYNETDLAFIDTLNNVLIVVAIIAFLVSLIAGRFISERISNPIRIINSTAQKISKGNYNIKSDVKSSTTEIIELNDTINSLGKDLSIQEDMRKQLTADVTHELRTPLTTLQGHLEAMLDGIWEADEARLGSCHEEVIRINKLIGDLERLARYEAYNLALDITRFDISEVIESTVSNFEIELNNKNIKVKMETKPIYISGDKSKIIQLLINLLTNSIKYTEAEGIISIKTDEQKDAVIISIKDTGIGIKKEELPFIFERFYRVDKSRSRINGGAGIGLTIVKAIVEAHNGKIFVESEEGIGTEFKVILNK